MAGHRGGPELTPAVSRAIEKVREIRTATPQPPKTFGYERIAGASAVTPKPLRVQDEVAAQRERSGR